MTLFALGASAPMSKWLLGNMCIVIREVQFPKEMTFTEYQSLGALYCDSASIGKFTESMKEAGELIGLYHQFSPHKITYTLIFKNPDEYQKYLNTINANWVNFEAFEKIGFKVDVRQIT